MDKYKETFETWDKMASRYQEKFMDLDLYDETYDFFCRSIPKEKARILEIACGPGNITRNLLSRRPDFNILGTDVSPNMINLARNSNPAADFKVMDCRSIRELQPGFDGIICGFGLPYLSPEDSSTLIAASSDLLSDGGMIYISFVGGDPGRSGFHTGSSGDRVYFYYHNPGQVKAELMKNHFEHLHLFQIAYPTDAGKELHTVLTGRKCTTIPSSAIASSR